MRGRVLCSGPMCSREWADKHKRVKQFLVKPGMISRPGKAELVNADVGLSINTRAGETRVLAGAGGTVGRWLAGCGEMRKVFCLSETDHEKSSEGGGRELGSEKQPNSKFEVGFLEPPAIQWREDGPVGMLMQFVTTEARINFCSCCMAHSARNKGQNMSSILEGQKPNGKARLRSRLDARCGSLMYPNRLEDKHLKTQLYRGVSFHLPHT